MNPNLIWFGVGYFVIFGFVLYSAFNDIRRALEVLSVLMKASRAVSPEQAGAGKGQVVRGNVSGGKKRFLSLMDGHECVMLSARFKSKRALNKVEGWEGGLLWDDSRSILLPVQNVRLYTPQVGIKTQATDFPEKTRELAAEQLKAHENFICDFREFSVPVGAEVIAMGDVREKDGDLEFHKEVSLLYIPPGGKGGMLTFTLSQFSLGILQILTVLTAPACFFYLRWLAGF